MGFWKTERGIGGDSWADELNNCMDALSKLKAKHYEAIGGVSLDSDDGSGHEITIAELADLIEFCTRGHIIAEVKSPQKYAKLPLSQIHHRKVVTFPNRGQIQS